MHIFWCNVKDDDKDNNTEINKCRKGIIMYSTLPIRLWFAQPVFAKHDFYS